MYIITAKSKKEPGEWLFKSHEIPSATAFRLFVKDHFPTHYNEQQFETYMYIDKVIDIDFIQTIE